MAFELICYLNFGYPTIEDGIRAARDYVESGCTALQIDIPSRDPYLEHASIQDRMRYCLEHTPDYEAYFEGICRIREMYPDLKLVLMLYENTVKELGVERIIAFCKRAGITMSTFVGSDDGIRRALTDSGVDIACYVQFHLPDDEVSFAKSSRMPTLLQVKSAGKVKPGYDSFEKCLAYLRNVGIGGPVYASVGIKTPEDVRMVKRAGADGAFVGSVLMDAAGDEKALKRRIAGFIAASAD